MRGRLPIILTITLLTASLPGSAIAAEAPWTPVTPALPRVENLGLAGLSDVTAVSPTDVWAVGSGWNNVDEPLIEHWTGAGWEPVKEPSVPNFQYTLSAVDAVSARDVWAVGSGMGAPVPNFRFVPVITHFDGSTWSLVPTPALAPLSAEALTGMDMVSATDGWAVGWRSGSNLNVTQPLVLRWRNGRWVSVRLPEIAGDHVLLQHVHARTADDVWAVGYADDSALVMHFDGARWSRVAVPHGGAANSGDDLRAVTAVSAGEVWAAGFTCGLEVDDIRCRPLVLRLSGGVWQVVPTAGDRDKFLLGVVARASDDVWVVGYDQPPGVQDANYVEHWDGQRFETVPADAGPLAVRGGLASALSAVTRIPGTEELWAVGWQDGNVPQVIRHG